MADYRAERVGTKRRWILLEIIDNTPHLQFERRDIEWMGDNIEATLQRQFDVTVDLIDVLDHAPTKMG